MLSGGGGGGCCESTVFTTTVRDGEEDAVSFMSLEPPTELHSRANRSAVTTRFLGSLLMFAELKSL